MPHSGRAKRRTRYRFGSIQRSVNQWRDKVLQSRCDGSSPVKNPSVGGDRRRSWACRPSWATRGDAWLCDRKIERFGVLRSSGKCFAGTGVLKLKKKFSKSRLDKVTAAQCQTIATSLSYLFSLNHHHQCPRLLSCPSPRFSPADPDRAF